MTFHRLNRPKWLSDIFVKHSLNLDIKILDRSKLMKFWGVDKNNSDEFASALLALFTHRTSFLKWIHSSTNSKLRSSLYFWTSTFDLLRISSSIFLLRPASFSLLESLVKKPKRQSTSEYAFFRFRSSALSLSMIAQILLLHLISVLYWLLGYHWKFSLDNKCMIHKAIIVLTLLYLIVFKYGLEQKNQTY